MAHWKQRETLFSEYGATLTLPGAWQLRPSDDPCRWFFRSSDKREQITISLTDLDGYEEAEEVKHGLHKARKAVELAFKRFPDFQIGESEVTEAEIGEYEWVPEAGFSGSAGEDEHRFRMFMIFREGQLWSFFYESFRLKEEDAEAHSLAIRQSLKFPQEQRGKKKRR